LAPRCRRPAGRRSRCCDRISYSTADRDRYRSRCREDDGADMASARPPRFRNAGCERSKRIGLQQHVLKNAEALSVVSRKETSTVRVYSARARRCRSPLGQNRRDRLRLHHAGGTIAPTGGAGRPPSADHWLECARNVEMLQYNNHPAEPGQGRRALSAVKPPRSALRQSGKI